MSRYGFVFLGPVIFAVILCANPVFATEGFNWWGEYELVCSGSEPVLQNIDTGNEIRIFGKTNRAFAKAICEIKAFTEECECIPVSVCPDGLTDCDGECVDLNTDEDNCGVCGKVCPFDSCIEGVCTK
jgi:hypothetical protein